MFASRSLLASIVGMSCVLFFRSTRAQLENSIQDQISNNAVAGGQVDPQSGAPIGGGGVPIGGVITTGALEGGGLPGSIPNTGTGGVVIPNTGTGGVVIPGTGIRGPFGNQLNQQINPNYPQRGYGNGMYQQYPSRFGRQVHTDENTGPIHNGEAPGPFENENSRNPYNPNNANNPMNSINQEVNPDSPMTIHKPDYINRIPEGVGK